MKLEFRLSNLAQKDLENIWIYTFENWSRKQADKYVKEILKQIEILCDNPQIGRPLLNIKPTHRVRKVNTHIIVYKVANNKIHVDRILHQRMDIKNHL